MTLQFNKKIIPILMCLCLCSCQTKKEDTNNGAKQELKQENDEVFKITFKDPNGVTLKVFDCPKDSTITYAYVPEEIEGYVCHFEGWSLTQGGAVLTPLPAATDNATYYAIVSKTLKEVTINYEYDIITNPDVNNLKFDINKESIIDINNENYFETTDYDRPNASYPSSTYKSTLINTKSITKIGIYKVNASDELTSEQVSLISNNLNGYKNETQKEILNLKTTDNLLPRRPNLYISTVKYITNSEVINEITQSLDLENKIFPWKLNITSEAVSSHSDVGNYSSEMIEGNDDIYGLEVIFENGVVQTYYINDHLISLHTTPITYYMNYQCSINTLCIAKYL